MNKNQPNLTIVIPALQEEKRIGRTLDKLGAFIKSDATMSELRVEVLIVSATSSDRTHEIVNDMARNFDDIRLLKPGAPLGKGRDVQYGMLRATGQAVLFMDADLATPLKYIPLFYMDYVRNNEDIIIATRNLLRHHKSVTRRLLSSMGNLLFRIAGGVWVEDSQCGFKLFSSEAARRCFSKLRIMGWGFDMEVLAIAKANNLKIKAVRINDWVSVAGGKFEKGFIKNMLTSLKELAYIFYRRIKKNYV